MKRAILAMASSLLCCGAVRAQAIEGADLMRILQDAQLANENRYPTGELWATLESGVEGALYPARRTQIHMRWNERRSRVMGIRRSWLLDSSGLATGGVTEDTPIDFIETEREYIAHYIDPPIVRIMSRLTAGPPPLTALRPDQVWYRANFNGRRWVELLGPHPNFPQKDVLAYKFTRLDENRIQMLRERTGVSRFRAVASRADDGNIVEFDSYYKDESVEQSYRTAYQWDRDSKGRCYLRSVEFRSRSLTKGQPSRGEGYTRMTIDRIDLDAVPDLSLFEMESFDLPPGTLVEDQINNRRYRIGELPVARVADSLDALISEASSRGFARPERK
jgi:hypothetical protein